MTPTDSTEGYVFKPSPYYQALGVGFGFVIALMFPGLFLIYAIGNDFYPGASNWGVDYWLYLLGGVVVLFIFLALGFYTYRSNAGQLLAIGPGGMVYKSSSRAALIVRWDDIESYGSASQSTASFSGFFVNGSLVKDSKFLENLAALKPFLMVLGYIGMIFGGRGVNPASYISTDLSYRSQIPMTLFDKNWENTEIGELIAKYCPRVFEPKEHRYDLNIVRSGDIPAPTIPQPANLQPPDVRSVKDNVVGFMLSFYSISVAVVFVVGFIFMNVRGGGPFIQPASTTRTATVTIPPTAATPIVEDKFGRLGPISGEMSSTLAIGDSNPTAFNAKNIKGLEATEVLTNPKDGKWSYGYTVIFSSTETLRFLIDSDGEYKVNEISGTNTTSEQTLLKSGTSSYIQTQPGKMNTFEILEQGGIFSFNANGYILDQVFLNFSALNYKLEMAYNPDADPANSTSALVYKDYDVKATSN